MSVQPPPFTTRPEISGTFGVVASTHWIASSVAMGILERGGNAFDAGAAAAFTLQVVEPHLNGPGGDTPILLHGAGTDGVKVICGQGPAPAGLSIAHCRKLGLDLVPGTGLLAPCIPGSFDAFMLLLRDYGTMRVRDVLEPAIHYARNGFTMLDRIVTTIASVKEMFEEHWTSSAPIYLPRGNLPVVGELFANGKLAETYERLLTEAESVGGDRTRQIEAARRVWSQGFVAEAIDTFCRTQEVMDSSGRAHFGVLNGQDMTGWKATIEEPISYDYRNYTVYKTSTWSQGLVALQQLALLSGFDLDGLDPAGPDFIHLQVECAKLAFADRDTFYGDPAFVDVPIGTLLSKAYNDERRKLVGTDASLELRPGRIDGFGGALDARIKGTTGLSVKGGAGEPTTGRHLETVDGDDLARGDTVHFDIIDRHGNMISSTPSGGWLQSSPVIPELGFCLGTRAQMFWLDEKHPAGLAPGRRPRSTLTPTIALRDGKPYLAWGSPGGDQQDQWIPQMLLRHIHAGMNLQQAIDAPAWHSEHWPSSFWPRESRPGVLVVESRVPEESVSELEKRGHTVEVGPPWSEGRLSAASKEGPMLKAAANPRGMQGYAVGR